MNPFIDGLKKKDNRKLILAFLLFILFIVLAFAGLLSSIANQQNSTIIASALGIIVCVVLCYFIITAIIKSGKKPVLPEPVKKGKTQRKK